MVILVKVKLDYNVHFSLLHQLYFSEFGSCVFVLYDLVPNCVICVYDVYVSHKRNDLLDHFSKGGSNVMIILVPP